MLLDSWKRSIRPATPIVRGAIGVVSGRLLEVLPDAIGVVSIHDLITKGRRIFTWQPLNPLARFVTFNMLGSAGSLLIGFGASIGLARWLGPSGRGFLGFMISVNSLALALASVGLPIAVIYFASRRDAEPAKILGDTLLYAAVMAVLLVPAGVLLDGQLAGLLSHGEGALSWALTVVLVPIVFLDWTTHGQLQGMMRFGRFNVLVVLSRVAYALAIVLLLGVLDLGVPGGLIATGVASGVMILGSLKPILERGSPRIDRALLRRMLHYGSRVQVGAIFQITNARLDVIILQFYRPLSQVGYYIVAQNVAELVITLARAFQGSMLPLASHYEGDERQAATSVDSIRHYGILAAAGVLGNAILGPLVIFFAFGSQFKPAIVPMLVLLPGIWFLGTGIVIQGDLGGRGRPGMSSALTGLAAGVTVVLDFALIPPLGVMGAALASVAAYSTFGVASLIALHRISGIPLRQLVVPTRADIALYLGLPRRAVSRIRRGFGSEASQ
jgi:O-antigen/teichoic acid export membrane protein